GGKTLDSLIITGPGGEPIVVDVSQVTVNENGYYTVENIDVSGFDDGILTVSASSTDVDGNTATVTDTVEKDFTYGEDIAPPEVSLTDNNGEEVINGEGETATITGFIGEGGESLDSLIITDTKGTQIVVDVSGVTLTDGSYEVTGIDVTDLLDGELTVTAGSTDVDGNTIEVTDTVEKDFIYGDDEDNDDEIVQPEVAITDNNGEEVINSGTETATITGFVGEGGKTLDSLIITDSSNNELVIDVSGFTLVDGNYLFEDINVSQLNEGTLTVTAKSTDVDGNKATITDTVTLDVNEAPEFISGDDQPGDVPNDDSYFFVALSKGANAGDTVGAVIAEDADGDVLSFSFEESNELFSIDSETGIITLKQGLADDVDCTHTFNVLVTDPNGLIDVTAVTVAFIGGEDNDAAWGLTPKKLNEVTEGNFGNSINVKLLEGGNVTIRAGASLVFSFAIANMAAGLTLSDYDVLINTADGFNSTFVERDDGTIDVIITNTSDVDKIVARGASDDDIVSMEIFATADNEVEGNETFTVNLVDVNIGQPKSSQDQINVEIIDVEPEVSANLFAAGELNTILAGLGEDILVATDDAESFVWVDGQLDDSTDVIQNFTVGEDSINLNNILEDTGSNNLDELLASIEVFVVGDDISLDITHDSGKQTIVIEDSREQFGELISDTGGFNAADILNQLVVQD
ncbi:cadherin repeat domain-containing protein, partial [Vibrio inusitatus]